MMANARPRARPADTAAEAITGRIVYKTHSGVWEFTTDPETQETTDTLVSPPGYESVPGTTVLAHDAKSSGSPGKVVASAITGADGEFSLAGLTTVVSLEVRPPEDWQPGWVWTEFMTHDPLFPTHVQTSPPPTCDIGPTTKIGTLQVLRSWASGRVVTSSADGVSVPIPGAKVRFEPVGRGKRGSAVTDPNGEFRVGGLDHEEYLVSVRTKHHTGYLGYGCRLYATEGQATSWGTGPIPCGDIVVIEP